MSSNNTYAATCDDISESYNASLYYACNSDGVRGALWLNDSSYTTDLWDSVTVTAADVEAGKKTIYLHGTVLGTSSTAKATYIIIQKGSSPISFSSNDAWTEAPDYGALGSFSSRQLDRYPVASREDSKIRSGVAMELTLDLDKLVELEGGRQTSYEVPLQVYRCFEGYSPSYNPYDNCYSDASRLNVTMPISYEGYTVALDTKDLCASLNDCLAKSDWYERSGWVFKPSKDMGTHKIEDCDPISGCYVQFRHYLWASQTGSQASYKIIRTITRADGSKTECYGSALSQSNDGETMTGCQGDKLYSKAINSSSGEFVDKSYVKLYPGDQVCDILTWYTQSTSKTSGYSTGKRITACAEAEGPSFEGRSNVWDASHTTGWFSSGNKDTTYYIENCDATKGCSVALSHHLRRNSGGGVTQYDITKETNGWNREPTSEEKEATASNLAPFVTVLRDTYTLYPGEKICETLNFSSNGTGNIDGHGTVCAVALGTATSSINVQVKNNTLNTDYGKSVYAKPGDSTTYKITYSPTLQYTKGLIVDNAMMSNSAQVWGNKDQDLQTLFNQLTTMQYGNKYAGKLSWNSAFWTSGIYDGAYRYSDGDRDQKEETVDWSAVEAKSREYAQTATIDPTDGEGNVIHYGEDGKEENNVWATPTKIEFINGSGLLASPQINSDTKDSAAVHIPYNFQNRAEITNKDAMKLYAGEAVEGLSYDVYVGTRENSVTQGNYATRVEDPKIRVCVYEESKGKNEETDCNIKEYNGTVWNENGSAEDKKVEVANEKPSGIVPDVPAGTSVCVEVSVYPANSGADENWSNPSGSNTWSNPAKECRSVMKKPSFQVWGGSLYSADGISAPSATKTSLAGFNIGSDTYTFGSWAELSLATSGENSVGSGAGLGYERNYDGTLQPNESPSNGLGNNARVNNGTPLPGGSKNSSAFCTVTFAGTKCGSSDLLGALSASSIALPTTDDFIATLKGEGYTIYENPDDITSSFNLYLDPDAPIKRLYSSDNNITISGNIIIGAADETRTNQTYTNFSLTPSIIIYTTGRINIQCGVTRIDATLIAGGTINTCSDEDADSLKKDSTGSLQLTINGALSANRIDFNRTYGAATGENSIVPAEIINYDSSLVLDYSSGTTESTPITLDDLTVQYIHELAPRY